MNNEAMKEVLNELFSHLERLETQSEAILQFLKEKKRVTDKQLAPYLEQAGNASNVKWRAARVRIDHLLEPEHPEKEAKLGKKPELQKDSARSGSDEDKQSGPVEKSVDKEGRRTELDDKEGKRIEAADQKQIESRDMKGQRARPDDEAKSAPVEAVQTRPADGKKDKPEEKLESGPAQDKREQKADSVHHPAEVTEPLVRQEGGEPAAQPDSKEKKSDQEAA